MRRSTTPSFVLYLIYLVALGMATALLVFWILVVQRFSAEINQLLSRLGFQWNHFHFFVASTGAVLIFLVILALTYLMAAAVLVVLYPVCRAYRALKQRYPTSLLRFV